MPSLSRGQSWDAANPGTLVVACSDGRFQEELDAFLHTQLGLRQYDRLYLPGGAGALAPSGIEFTRAQQVRKECQFLIEAHGIERVILLFHGPAADGPEEAACGDYRRKFPGRSAHEIRRRQDDDLTEVLRSGISRGVTVECYRCEVTALGTVQFVPMPTAGVNQ